MSESGSSHLTVYADCLSGKLLHYAMGLSPLLLVPMPWRGGSFQEVSLGATDYEVVRVHMILRPSAGGTIAHDINARINLHHEAQPKMNMTDFLAQFNQYSVQWTLIQTATVVLMRFLREKDAAV